jgi:tetratricopeptide (TPR) repeat protein
MIRRTFPAILAVLAWGSGCMDGPPRAPSAPVAAEQEKGHDPASLPPVVLPDLSALADSVQRQVKERERQLADLLARPGASAADRAGAYGALGRVLMAANFQDEAIVCYRHAEALVPNDMRWPYFLAHACLRKGDRPSAVAALDRVLRLSPTDLPSLVLLGETHLDEGRLDLAQSTFARALAVQPQSAAALFGAGRTALARQAYADAVQYMERALAVDPRASAIHYPLAMAYRATGSAANVEAHLRQRGTASPELADPLMQDGDILESAVALEGHGMQALRAADFAGAAAAFRKGLELSPGDASLRYWLGAALYAAGNTTEAEQEFLAVVRQAPGFARAHFSLGAIEDARGRRAEAITRYRAAVRADPGMPDARLRLAAALRMTGQLEAALPEYQAVTRLDPTIVEAWIGGAETLIKLGRNPAAQEWLAQARRLHPGRAELAEMQKRLSADPDG